MLPSRDKDQLGIGVAIASNGNKYKQQQAALGNPVDDSETTIELTYRIHINPWLAVQPDIHWIKNPGMNPALSDATVLGIRTKEVI